MLQYEDKARQTELKVDKHDIFQTKLSSNFGNEKKTKKNHNQSTIQTKLRYLLLKPAKKSKITKKLISSVEINIIAETCL